MTDSNGINGGKNAGRICWLIANTMCRGDNATTFEDMITTCTECDFYKLVKEEEGNQLMLSLDMLQETYEENKARETKRRAKN